MSKEYTLGHHEGRPAMFNSRGLVCTFEAGYQQTREQDAKKVCAAMNAAPDLYAALEACMTDENAHCLQHQETPGAMARRLRAINEIAQAALSRARGE